MLVGLARRASLSRALAAEETARPLVRGSQMPNAAWPSVGPTVASVLRAGLAYPVMELQLYPGRERERPVHGFGHEPCHVAAERSDAGEQDVHSATTSNEIFLTYQAAENSVGT